MRREIEAKLSEVQNGLDILPESFSENPQGKLLTLCTEFDSCIRECTTGSEPYSSFFEALYKEFETLSNEITATRPNFEIPQKAARKETPAITVPAILDNVTGFMSVPPPYPTTPVITESESKSESEIKCRQTGHHFLLK